MIQRTIEHWDDVGVTVIFSQRYKSCIDFRAVEIVATNIRGIDGPIAERGWTKKGGCSNLDLVYDPEQAERYVGGGIKWNGCANIYFGPEQDKGYMHLHLCGPEDVEKMATVLKKIYARCGELLGNVALVGVWK